VLKRFLIGLLKGLLVGGAIGAGLQFGLGWAPISGVLGFLLAMGTTATAGLVAGKPPWRQETIIEGALKATGGLILGALLYWLGSSFAAVPIPFAIPAAHGAVEAGTSWTALPILVLPILAGLYAALIELDNNDDDDSPKGTGTTNGSRGSSTEIEDAVILD
jgi:hypothetical protein